MPTSHDQSSGSIATDSGSATEATDLLSNVLKTVRLTGAVFFTVDASSPWYAEVPDGRRLAPALLPSAQQVISYHAVTSGSCWGALPGGAAVELSAGDVLLLPQGDRYCMSTGNPLVGRADDESEIGFLRQMANGELPHAVSAGGGGGSRATIVCGFLGCDLLPYNPLLGSLPRLMRSPAAADPARDPLTGLLGLALEETRRHEPGRDCVLMRLAELLFVQLLRRHFGTLSPDQTGWLAGLRDPVVGRVLSLLHERPAHGWTLEELVQNVGLSRSALSERFAKLIGCAPMQYLGAWRMQIAAGLLADGNAKVATVASQVGYDSEAAFSRAFKKATGMAPALWRTQPLDRHRDLNKRPRW